MANHTDKLNNLVNFPDSARMTRGRVLVLDDNPQVLQSIARVLNSNGYKTTPVSQANQALEMVKAERFDLVTCDVNMPGMGGLQFLMALRGIDPSLPSVVITASGSVGMAVQAMKCGALGFVTKPFTQDELLESVKAALNHAHLVQERTTSKLYAPLLEGASAALLQALEAKDRENQGHGQSVAVMSQRLALRYGLSQEEAAQVYFAGLFHDIGKIGIPDAILLKAGPLTPEEQEQMMHHPQIGAKIIGTVADLTSAADYILHHHERYDGTGYPNGLRGQEIPLGSRIVFVADVYEQLISKQSYAPEMSEGEALLELENGSGSQLDPVMVEMFIEMLPHLPLS